MDQARNPSMAPARKIDPQVKEKLLENREAFELSLPEIKELSTEDKGQTLLDHYAGIALNESYRILKGRGATNKQIAESSYDMAQAMLEERCRIMDSEEKEGADE